MEERIINENETMKVVDEDVSSKLKTEDVSYYIISDLSKFSIWEEPGVSNEEWFDDISKAVEQFNIYRATKTNDEIGTTLGVCLQGNEFNLIYARNNESILSTTFTHVKEALANRHFMNDLQILCTEVGIDTVRVDRNMSSEEMKSFVKERFEYQLDKSGLEDTSIYMKRFDALYKDGHLEYLMPTEREMCIVENIPFEKWENPYISIKDSFVKDDLQEDVKQLKGEENENVMSRPLHRGR